MTISNAKALLTRRLYNLGLEVHEVAELTGRTVSSVRMAFRKFEGNSLAERIKVLRDRGVSRQQIAMTLNCSIGRVPVIREKLPIPRGMNVPSALWERLTLEQQKWVKKELRRTGDLFIILQQLIPSACPDSVRTFE